MVGRKTSCPAALPAVKQADHQALPLLEPARRDQRREIGAGEAAADPDDDAPQQHQLPRLGIAGRQRHAERGGGQRQRRSCGARRTGRSAPRRTGRSRRKAAVDPDRERDRRARPLEFVFQRHDQHAGRGAHAGRQHDDHEGDRGDDPGVMQPAGPGTRRRPAATDQDSFLFISMPARRASTAWTAATSSSP